MAGRRGFGGLRKLPSGRWQASYLGPDGKRWTAPTTYAAKVDAEGWLIDERRLLERVGPDGWLPPGSRDVDDPTLPAPAPPDPRTLREYSEEWIATKLATKDITETTAEKYRQAMKMRVLDFEGRPALGDIRVVDLTRKQVSTWWRGLDHQEHERACDLAYQALRACLNFALREDELITENPCQVKGAGAASAQRSIEPLTPAQVQVCADAMPAQWAIGVHLGAWCSIRSGEVRELRRGDIDLDAARPVIRVRRGVVRASGQLKVSAPKTAAGVRVVQIPAPVVELLRDHLRRYAQIGAEGLLVWSADTGAQVHDSSWGRAWRRAAKAAGVKGFRFHDLRHTGLTYAAISGATIKELQEMAGHTTPAMAMRYQEVANQHLDGVIDRLGELIEG